MSTAHDGHVAFQIPREVPNRLASDICAWLSRWMSEIGVAGHPESLEVIDSTSRSFHEALEKTLDKIPGATAKAVRECGLALCAKISDSCVDLNLEGLSDPRSYRDISLALSDLSSSLTKNPSLDSMFGKCLSELDARGALGLDFIRDLAMFLVSLDQSPDRSLVVRGSLLILGDVSLDIHRVHSFGKHLLSHNPLWGPRSVVRALHSEVVRFSGNTMTNSICWSSMVVGPSGGVESLDPGVPFWAHVDDHEMAYVSNFVEFDSGFDAESKASIHLSVRVMESVVQKAWLDRFKVSIKLDPRLGSFAHQLRGTRTIWCGHDALRTPCTLVAELARSLDDHLFSGPGYSSESESEDFCAFVDIVRPDVIQANRLRIERMADLVFESVIRRRLAVGEDDDFISSIPGAFGDVVRFDGDLDAVSLARVLSGVGEVHEAEFIRFGRTGSGFDPDLALKLFVSKRLEEMASGPVIFSCFLEQYARLYWLQQGRSYGPRTLFHDLDPFVLVKHVSSFHSVLASAQVRDLRALKSSRVSMDMESRLGAFGATAAFGAFVLASSRFGPF